MAAISDVADGIATVLGNITGLQATAYVPELVSPPFAFVHLHEITESTMGYESLDLHIDAAVLVARGALPRIGQQSLYDFYRLMVTAISAQDDLGLGDGTQARVVRYRALGTDEVAAYNCYGGAYELIVTTPG